MLPFTAELPDSVSSVKILELKSDAGSGDGGGGCSDGDGGARSGGNASDGLRHSSTRRGTVGFSLLDRETRDRFVVKDGRVADVVVEIERLLGAGGPRPAFFNGLHAEDVFLDMVKWANDHQ